MERRELLERLAPLIPPPRAHQVRYHGILAPWASGRDRVVPGRETNGLVRQPVKDEPSCLVSPPTTWIDGPSEGPEARLGYGSRIVPLPSPSVLRTEPIEPCPAAAETHAALPAIAPPPA